MALNGKVTTQKLLHQARTLFMLPDFHPADPKQYLEYEGTLTRLAQELWMCNIQYVVLTGQLRDSCILHI